MHWGVFLIVAVGVWGLLFNQINNWVVGLGDPGIQLRFPAGAVLALDPQTQTLKTGQTFAINIMLNTGDKPIDGVDIYSLHYDPSLLQVVDDNPGQKGTQITPGKILPLNAANMVDDKLGLIKFGQVAKGGTSYTGTGVLATIHFRAVNSGTAFLKFDFSQGSTIDSNAAYRGQDKLARVVDGIYTISK